MNSQELYEQTGIWRPRMVTIHTKHLRVYIHAEYDLDGEWTEECLTEVLKWKKPMNEYLEAQSEQ